MPQAQNFILWPQIRLYTGATNTLRQKANLPLMGFPQMSFHAFFKE
jgi:hypothetical protein